MQVQVHTDSHVDGSDAMARWASEAIAATLARFAAQITRVEAHFSDDHGGKKTQPAALTCTLEARVEGLPPVVAKHGADTLNHALSGAAEKLLRAVEHSLARSAA